MASPSLPNALDASLVKGYAGENVFWVRGTSNAKGVGLDQPNQGTRDKPFATIDYAVGQCTANQGDMIMVMPGYVQTISAVNGILFDVAGVRCIGLGNANDKPTFTYSDAAGSINVTADDVVVENFIHIANDADVALPCETTAAGTYWLNHQFRDNAANENFDGVFGATGTDRACDFLTIKNCSYVSVDTQAFNFLEVANDVHYLVMQDCVHWSHATATVEMVDVAAGASLFGALIQRCYTHNLDIADAISLIVHTDQTDSTGIAADCFSNTRDTAGELLTTASSGIQYLRCRGSSVVDTQGYTLPTIDNNA